jgi:secreted trypsin-like serine protease
MSVNCKSNALLQNDEGAPLMCISEGGVWELQGVLSYHSNCGQGYHPSIFSSITAVRGWVEKTVGSHFERKSTFNVRRRRGLNTLH